MTKKNQSKRKSQPRKRSRKARKPQSKPRPQQSIGAQIGSMLGQGIQNFGTSVFKRITGMGDYKMSEGMANLKTNCLFQNSNNQPPSFGGGRSGFVFEHSEYIGDVITSPTAGAFNATTYPINPANALTFPWLANMASNFEYYEILGMLFRYESSSGNAISGTNAALGTVMGYTAYDTLDTALISKSQLLQYEGCVDARMDQNFLAGVECDPSQTVMPRLYVGAPPPGSDPKMYNHGNFTIATQGGQAVSANVGELWVHYKIKFHVTKQQSASSSVCITMNTVSPSTFTNPPASISGTLGLVSVPSGSSIVLTNFNVGQRYQLTYQLTAGSAVGVGSNAITYSGATSYNYLNNHTSSSAYGNSGANKLFTAFFTAAMSTITITYTSADTYSSTASATFLIAAMDNVTI